MSPEQSPANIPTGRRWFELPVVAGVILLLAAIIPYLNSFGVPWYFDDVPNIVENPLVRDLPAAARSFLHGRGPAIFSFALNYRLGGLDPFGFHLVNLAIHAGATLCAWLLLRQMLGRHSPWALAGALLFAVHPLQTQGVTYVVQRMTSLSALFFLAASCAWLAYLDAAGNGRRRWYLLALLSGALAVLTKQNAAVLPLALLCLERMFRPGRDWRRQLAALAPFCLVPAWKTAEVLFFDMAPSHAAQLQSLQGATPLRYLVTEFTVLWHYLRLLVLPVGQVLDYGWPVSYQLLTPGNALAGAGLVALGWLAWRVRHRQPLLAFGIAWFFLTLSVESSLIPLDPAFEHRLYLPMVGFVLVVIALLQSLPRPQLQGAVVVAVVLVLAVLTWQRNALWSDQVAFYEDNLRQRPGNVRVMALLANTYAEEKRNDEALQMAEGALRLDPSYDYAIAVLGKVLINRMEGARAIEPLQRGAQQYPDSIHINEYLGIAYGQTGDLQQAITHLRRAMLLAPEKASILANLGVAYAQLGDLRLAVEYFERSLRLVPDSEETLFNYAAALFRTGDKPRVLEVLRRLVAVNPTHVEAQYNRGALGVELGFPAETAAARAALLQVGDEARVARLDALVQR